MLAAKPILPDFLAIIMGDPWNSFYEMRDKGFLDREKALGREEVNRIFLCQKVSKSKGANLVSKKAKKTAQDRRRADKARRKASNQAMYSAWRDSGQNSKRSKRNKLSSGSALKTGARKGRVSALSTIKKSDGGFLTVRQVRNQLNFKAFHRMLSA